MTPQTPIMIVPQVQLASTIPPADLAVVRRVLLEHVKGVDAEADRRWRRLLGDLFRAEAGEAIVIIRSEGRVGPYHRMHRAWLQRLFDAQERFDSIDALHDWLKLKVWFVEWRADGGKSLPVPRSTAYDRCSEDDVRHLHASVCRWLHSPTAAHELWPHLTDVLAAEMVEWVMTGPRGGD